MIQANNTHSLPLRLLTKTTDTHKCQQNGSKVIVDNSAIGVQCASNNHECNTCLPYSYKTWTMRRIANDIPKKVFTNLVATQSELTNQKR